MKAFPSISRKQGGFTLVEMLLAVSLMAVLLGRAYGGLRSAVRTADKGQVILLESGQVRSTHQFIRRQINQMVPLAYAEDDSAEGFRTVFEGSAASIQFVAPMPGYLGAGGPQVQLIEIAPAEEGMQLLFSHALLQDFDQTRLYERDPIVLLEKVRDAEFSFLARDEFGELTGWATDWDDPENLPLAVRLNVELAGATQVDWPALTAGVRVDTQSVAPAPQVQQRKSTNDFIREAAIRAQEQQR